MQLVAKARAKNYKKVAALKKLKSLLFPFQACATEVRCRTVVRCASRKEKNLNAKCYFCTRFMK